MKMKDNKTKLKVFTVVGTRPEIIRLSRVISSLDKSESIHNIIIHTGKNYDYELYQVFFEDLGIRKPDFFFKCCWKNIFGNYWANFDQN